MKARINATSLIFALLSSTSAFLQVSRRQDFHCSVQCKPLHSSRQSTTTLDTAPLRDLISNAEKLIVESKGKVPIETIDPLLESIEAQTTYDEPNRSPIYKGTWHVWYSNAPPPSNGQLGPFLGSAEQVIASQGDSYKNILRLPPYSDDNEWLTVVLDGIWEDWDGQELKDNDSNASSSNSESTATKNSDPDWGAKFWKVTFLRLDFSFFGNQFLSKEFPAGVSRVWRTTYLDDETRIVRAGRTGKPDDESVFYMKRSPRPSYI